MKAGVPNSEEYLGYEMDERQIFFLFLGTDFPHFRYKAPTMLPAGSIVGALYHKL